MTRAVAESDWMIKHSCLFLCWRAAVCLQSYCCFLWSCWMVGLRREEWSSSTSVRLFGSSQPCRGWPPVSDPRTNQTGQKLGTRYLGCRYGSATINRHKIILQCTYIFDKTSTVCSGEEASKNWCHLLSLLPRFCVITVSPNIGGPIWKLYGPYMGLCEN